jgi:hypothetical protein
MKTKLRSATSIKTLDICSYILQRTVRVDIYIPKFSFDLQNVTLLLINDGQNLEEIHFENILEDLMEKKEIEPLLCIGIHAAKDRKIEYGTANVPDCRGRGAKAADYTQFIFKELLPFVKKDLSIESFRDKSFCGFSLGGLSALDIVWNHPQEFRRVGVFSGSLWWRTVDQDEKYFDEDKHRIMHNEIKNGNYYPWLRFFFETGILDETADRNKNGIIDSIDDTLSLIKELEVKGYKQEDIKYLELEDGRHDIATWGRALPDFLKWGWGIIM